MPKYFYIAVLFLVSTAFFFLFGPSPTLAQFSSDATIIHLQIDNCNNNGICEPLLGENYQGCPLDCPAPTSTPPAPTSTPPSGGGGISPLTGGGGSQNNNQNFPGTIILPTITVVVTSHSAVISWQTYGESLGTLSWGRTPDGELGTISEINYGSVHRVEIDRLESASRYFFKIESKDRNGNIFYFGPRGFVTDAETLSPENIRDFRADLVDSHIHLSWKNPRSKNFQSVRILRSENFYPDDPENGKIMYEGRGEGADDTVIKAGGDYYYSAFAEDYNGNFSSGSVVHVKLKGPSGSSSNPKPPPKNIIIPLEFYVGQNQDQIPFMDNIAHVKVGEGIRISISPDFLPDNVRYFIINVEDENVPGTFHSYLLRHAKNVSIFETIIPAFNKEGRFSFSVSLLNSKQEEMGRFEGAFEVGKASFGFSPLGFWRTLLSWILAIFHWLLRILGLY